MERLMMGICFGKKFGSDEDSQLSADRQEEQEKIKLLLLGPAESGKSTILKQMKILHANGFNTLEVDQYKPIIRSNIIDGMLSILAALEALDLTLASTHTECVAAGFRKEAGEADPYDQFSVSMQEAISTLFYDPAVQSALARGSEFNLPDAVPYFLDSINRISSDKYIPTTSDILHARVVTTGIIEIKIPYKKFPLYVVDVGGQRSQRKKWLHCFDDVNAVMFIVSVAGYDQTLNEDNETNRLSEALRVFASICNNDSFHRSGMILYLNKIDLFAQKIKRVPLKVCFQTYKGSQDYQQCLDYIQRRFEMMNHFPKKKIYSHFTCATDTRQVEFVLDACFDLIVSTTMKTVGLE